MPAYSLTDLKHEFRLTNDGDSWGSVMSWLFRIADSLTFHHGVDVPGEWAFRPSPFGRADDPAEDYQAGICDSADPETLLAFGRILWRVRGILQSHGEDY